MNEVKFYSIEELIRDLNNIIDPFELNKIESAYEMAENALNGKLNDAGNSLFYHSSRVCKILIKELKIFEPELIITALLHELVQYCPEISSDIIEFNFGKYTSFLIEIVNDDIEVFALKNNEIENVQLNNNRIPLDDYLILKLAELLDKTRFCEIKNTISPIDSITLQTSKILPYSEKSLNPKIIYLSNQIKIERNKFSN